MRLITFKNNNKIGIGSLKGDQVIPFSQSTEIPDDMLSFLQEGEGTITKANDICSNPEEIIALKEVNILGPVLAPIAKMRKKYRCRILIRYPKNLFLQKYLSQSLNKIKIISGIKLEVDVDPINFS